VTLTPTGTGSATATAACTVSNAAAGTYNPTAAYGGDADYNASSDQTAIVTVSSLETPSVNVSATNGKSGGTEHVVFTAQVAPLLGTDPTPTGTISWAVSASDGSTVTCTPNPGTITPDGKKANTASVTCTISPTSATVTYTAAATYMPASSSSATYTSSTGSGSSPG
jgi:hypothetical protein